MRQFLFLALLSVPSTALAGDLQWLSHGLWVVSSDVDENAVTTMELAFWMDARVPDWSWEKSVGIVWTDDHWATSQTADSWYEGNLGGGYEQWGTDIVPIGTVRQTKGQVLSWNGIPIGDYPYCTVEIEYAIFYTMPWGYTIWDNNGGANYHHMLATCFFE